MDLGGPRLVPYTFNHLSNIDSKGLSIDGISIPSMRWVGLTFRLAAIDVFTQSRYTTIELRCWYQGPTLHLIEGILMPRNGPHIFNKGFWKQSTTNNNNSSIIGESNMSEIKSLLEKCLLEQVKVS